MTTTKDAEFFKLDVAALPDDLFQADVPVEKWLDRCETAPKGGFPPNAFTKIHPIEWDVHLERLVGISLYMWMNVAPFMILPLAILYVTTWWARYWIYFLVVYTITFSCLEKFFFEPLFLRKYRQAGYLEAADDDYRQNQYVFTERNTSKYLSTSLVWPKSCSSLNSPVLFCVVPHGVAPFGITAYPFWSKVWNNKLCRWTTAPVVLQIPIVNYLIKKIGYIPAKAGPMLSTLEADCNVGVILDGIAGMFQPSTNQETAFLNQRKGIVKIALKAGVPIVPVYAFGHTDAYTVLVDPFGILEQLSNTLQASLCPFLGRWGWPLGPPRRVPITMCLGNPVNCAKVERPTQEQIDNHHAQLLDSYKECFEQHKEAYGWKHKTLKFV